MKAILIRRLTETAKKPIRLKAIIEGQKPFISSNTNIDEFVGLTLAKFGFSHLDYGIGQLANGDHVVTLKDQHTNVAMFVDMCGLHETDSYTLIGSRSDCIAWCERERFDYGYIHYVIVKTVTCCDLVTSNKIKLV